MKHLLLILSAFVALASAESNSIMQEAIIDTAELFSIDNKVAEICFRDAKVTLDDLGKVSEALVQAYSTLINTKDIDNIRRAACAFTCCAQKQGMVSGSKIQVDKVEDVIKRKKMPLETETHYKRVAKECENRVKDITDECFVGLEFYKCLIHLPGHGYAH